MKQFGKRSLKNQTGLPVDHMPGVLMVSAATASATLVSLVTRHPVKPQQWRYQQTQVGGCGGERLNEHAHT